MSSNDCVWRLFIASGFDPMRAWLRVGDAFLELPDVDDVQLHQGSQRATVHFSGDMGVVAPGQLVTLEEVYSMMFDTVVQGRSSGLEALRDPLRDLLIDIRNKGGEVNFREWREQPTLDERAQAMRLFEMVLRDLNAHVDPAGRLVLGGGQERPERGRVTEDLRLSPMITASFREMPEDFLPSPHPHPFAIKRNREFCFYCPASGTVKCAPECPTRSARFTATCQEVRGHVEIVVTDVVSDRYVRSRWDKLLRIERYVANCIELLEADRAGRALKNNSEQSVVVTWPGMGDSIPVFSDAGRHGVDPARVPEWRGVDLVQVERFGHSIKVRFKTGNEQLAAAVRARTRRGEETSPELLVEMQRGLGDVFRDPIKPCALCLAEAFVPCEEDCLIRQAAMLVNSEVNNPGAFSVKDLIISNATVSNLGDNKVDVDKLNIIFTDEIGVRDMGNSERGWEAHAASVAESGGASDKPLDTDTRYSVNDRIGGGLNPTDSMVIHVDTRKHKISKKKITDDGFDLHIDPIGKPK